MSNAIQTEPFIFMYLGLRVCVCIYKKAIIDVKERNERYMGEREVGNDVVVL